MCAEIVSGHVRLIRSSTMHGLLSSHASAGAVTLLNRNVIKQRSNMKVKSNVKAGESGRGVIRNEA